MPNTSVSDLTVLAGAIADDDQLYVVDDFTGTPLSRRIPRSSLVAGLIDEDGTVPLTANWDVGNFGLTMLDLTMDGDLLLQSATDSANALRILDSSGSSVLAVDTLNESVTIGAAADATYVARLTRPTGGRVLLRLDGTSGNTLISGNNANTQSTSWMSFSGASGSLFNMGGDGSIYLRQHSSGNGDTLSIDTNNATFSGNLQRWNNQGTLVASMDGSGILTNGGLVMTDGADIELRTVTGTIIGTTTSQLLSFFAATPIAQQTTTSQTAAAFVANTSGISDDTATWGGYTVGDIVAILQAFGLIA